MSIWYQRGKGTESYENVKRYVKSKGELNEVTDYAL